jgi:heterotetrameric sarcosine oxidase delta subunit
MLLIDCPNCGPRSEEEFGYGGDATVTRPVQPGTVSDEAWTAYLFQRENPRGPHLEYWFHRFGCRRWIKVRRDTLTHHIDEVMPCGRADGRSGR